MRLTKVLHPEILLNKRGPLEAREVYLNCLPHVGRENGVYTLSKEVRRLDENIQYHLLLCHKFFNSNKKVFHVGKGIIEALLRVDREVPVQYMPDNLLCYFSFPDGIVFDGMEEVQGAYVYIGDTKETHISSEFWGHKCIWSSYITKGVANDDSNFSIGYNCMELTNEKVANLLSKIESTGECNVQDFENLGGKPINKGSKEEVYRLLINLVLYTSSEGAEFLELDPIGNYNKKKHKKIEKKLGYMNECTLPVTLLSWNYHNENREYMVDSTWVETHPRWQPCGPNLSLVKLIWVKGHERHYKGVSHE